MRHELQWPWPLACLKMTQQQPLTPVKIKTRKSDGEVRQ